MSQKFFELQGEPVIEQDDVRILMDGDGTGWLGVETHEVTADKAKELKLPAERGVVLGKIVPDSPAAKGGFEEKERSDGGSTASASKAAAQFRRMIHEFRRAAPSSSPSGAWPLQT